jgi:acyl-CoA reductase-like NAD-dependent aldehyde dehydrogenase
VEIIQHVFPADVLQVIPAAGPAVPQALVTHPDVRYVSFTGSTKAGKAVGKAAADSVTPLALELGGKNAFIVYDDADLELVVRNAIEGGFFNQGEACTAASRILCQSGIHDSFVSRLSAAVKRLVVGDGADQGTHVGPLVTLQQQKQVLEYIRIGTEEGAHISAQAPLPDTSTLEKGYFAPPTLFTNVTRHMRIAKDEVFGPVVTVTKFETHEEAIEITNESEYGLVCSIHTTDVTKALRASREVDVGIVFINNYFRNLLGTPFGGVKQSGYGREHCIQTLREYSHPKNIRFPSGMGTVPTWAALPDLFD